MEAAVQECTHPNAVRPGWVNKVFFYNECWATQETTFRDCQGIHTTSQLQESTRNTDNGKKFPRQKAETYRHHILLLTYYCKHISSVGHPLLACVGRKACPVRSWYVPHASGTLFMHTYRGDLQGCCLPSPLTNGNTESFTIVIFCCRNRFAPYNIQPILDMQCLWQYCSNTWPPNPTPYCTRCVTVSKYSSQSSSLKVVRNGQEMLHPLLQCSPPLYDSCSSMLTMCTCNK